MGWHFVDLTDDQKHERRETLDKYASIAQLSALVPLVAVQCYLFLSFISSRGSKSLSTSSPRHKAGQLGDRIRIRRIAQAWNQFQWLCGEPLDIRGTYLGSRGEVLLALSWLTWLLMLCMLQTGNDYLHLTKRFGIVAASQLPLHYLLAMKSELSPIQILTRRSHEALNGIHQLLGRVTLLLLYLHGSFYLNFYIQKDLLASKIKEVYVICGIVAIMSLTVLGITASPPVRHWSYRGFYAVHITVAAAILPVLFFHVSHIRLYLYESLFVYGINVLLRKVKSRRVTGAIKRLGNTNLVEIHISKSSFERKDELHRWQPGQHGYLSIVNDSLSQIFRVNPFSVASIPINDGCLRFVARVLNGSTSLMAIEANSGKLERQIRVEGPYGISNHSGKLLHYDRVLFIAGGIGGTFISPLYRQLLADLSPSKGSYRRQKVLFTWTARHLSDVAWALPENDQEKEGYVERLRVHLTGWSAMSSASDNTFDGRELGDDAVEDGIELEEWKNLLSGESNATDTGISVCAGRPKLKLLVDGLFSQSASERVAVLACGPRALTRDLRRELKKWVAGGREVWYWEEAFAL